MNARARNFSTHRSMGSAHRQNKSYLAWIRRFLVQCGIHRRLGQEFASRCVEHETRPFSQQVRRVTPPPRRSIWPMTFKTVHGDPRIHDKAIYIDGSSPQHGPNLRQDATRSGQHAEASRHSTAWDKKRYRHADPGIPDPFRCFAIRAPDNHDPHNEIVSSDRSHHKL